MAAPNVVGDPYEQPYKLQKASATGITAPQHFPLRRIVEGHGDVLGPVCRSHGVDPEAVIAQLWVASQKQPGLLKATPASLVTAVARAIESGGIIGRDVHILAFGTEATDCLDYKFMAELVVAAGGARSIDARIVYKGDTFREIMGSEPRLVHEPPPFGTKRGAMIGAYAIAYHGVHVPPRWVALTLEEIEAVRTKSKSWGPSKVRECPDWYALKTCVRRLVKLLPKNPRLAAVMQRIDAAESVHESPDEIVGEITPVPAEAPVTVEGAQDAFDERDPALVAALDRVVNGKRLGDLRNRGLTAIRKWASGKAAKDGDPQGRLDSIIAACDLIVEAREAGEIEEPAKEVDDDA